MPGKNYSNVDRCGQEIAMAVNEGELKSPTGSVGHLDGESIAYCGFLDSVNHPEDKRHCPYLGRLILVGEGPRYICTAFEAMKRAGIVNQFF